MDELKPAFGEERFFFEDEHDEMEAAALDGAGSSGQIFQPAHAGRGLLADTLQGQTIGKLDAGASGELSLEQLEQKKIQDAQMESMGGRADELTPDQLRSVAAAKLSAARAAIDPAPKHAHGRGIATAAGTPDEN
eukprot:SAG22_NODE_750_length_7481_cov_19.618667_4_plen_135_part_00